MPKKLSTILLVIVAAATAFFLGPVIWTPSPDLVPTAQQLPFFMVISAIEALTFGIGVTFLIAGPSYIRQVERDRGWAWALYLCIAWLLVSWWPHDNMHIHNGMNAWGLVRIDYMFHLTLIIAGCVIAYRFLVTGGTTFRSQAGQRLRR